MFIAVPVLWVSLSLDFGSFDKGMVVPPCRDVVCVNHMSQRTRSVSAQVIRGISSKYIRNFGCDFIISECVPIAAP